MKTVILVPLLCASLSLFTTGCHTMASVKFRNGTSATISVRSTHTGNTFDISAGKIMKVPHAMGDFVVTTETKEQYRFSDVSVMDIPANYRVVRSSPFGPGYVTAWVLLETNMALYVVMPGEKTVTQKVKQPVGYPKVGVKVGN